MQVNITFRGMDPSDSLKTYVKDRVERVEKYFDRAIEAHAVLSLERYLQHADFTIQAGSYLLRGKARSEDMYKSIDEAMDKLERQLKRYKGKLRAAKVRASKDSEHVRVRHNVLEVAGPEVDEAVEEWAQGPKVIRSDEFLAKSMSVDEAVMQMDLMNAEFLVFTDVQTGGVNVIYRRDDGHFGLIEATPKPAARAS